MQDAETYAAFARLLLPDGGDPRQLLRHIPDGMALVRCLPESLVDEHARAFGPTPSADAPPYESYYGAPHVFLQAHQLADIAGFYRAFGLQADRGERPDHIAVELEFLHFLSVKERLAREAGRAEDAETCRRAREAFLRDHPGRWVAAFARRFRAAGRSRFYSELLDRLARFVGEECARLGVVPELASSAELRAPEPDVDPACGSCPLSEFGPFGSRP